MIIGISGKAQSGKDTVAKIIQMMLAIQPQSNDNIISFISNNVMYLDTASHWKIVRFADKVKDVVCLMIGCTREQLEDEVFKNTELGEEWDKYIWKGCCNNVGIESFITSGDTCSNCGDVPEYDITKLTPRMLLQQVGIDMGRVVHPNAWVNSVMSGYMTREEMIRAKARGNRTNAAIAISNAKNDPINWLIPDVRFPNELNAIEDRGGFVIRVERARIVGMQYTTKDGRDNRYIIPEHTSEKALDNHSFKHTINNNGTIKELIEQVKGVLIDRSII